MSGCSISLQLDTFDWTMGFDWSCCYTSRLLLCTVVLAMPGMVSFPGPTYSFPSIAAHSQPAFSHLQYRPSPSSPQCVLEVTKLGGSWKWGYPWYPKGNVLLSTRDNKSTSNQSYCSSRVRLNLETFCTRLCHSVDTETELLQYLIFRTLIWLLHPAIVST